MVCAVLPGAIASAAPFVPVRDAHCVAISPDGTLVAIGISGQSNGEFPPRPHPSPRKSAVVMLFDVMSRKRLRRLETFGDLTKLAFSRDGRLVAASRLFSMDDGVELNEVRVWDVATGQPRFVFDRCHAFSFAYDRDEITVASRKRCVTYNLLSGGKISQIPSLAAAVNLAHAADGTRILGIVQQESGFSLRACSGTGSDLVAESVSLAEPFYSLSLPRAGNALATGHTNGTVFLRDVDTLQPVSRLLTGGRGRAFPFFSPNGELVAAADQSNSDVVVWEVATAKELARYTFQQGSLRTYGLKSPSRLVRPEEDPARFVFSPDGEAFLGGPYGGILRLISTGRDIARFGE